MTATIQVEGIAPTTLATPRVRRDIQGLRAVAVIAVILDHLLHWPSGGFAGVDVFFVISGFLITDMLFRRHETTATNSFTAFYGRRIRRIVPAAVTVLVVTTALGFLLFNRGRALSTLLDAVFAFFFVSNWHFAATGTDYFQAGDSLSPLQHFWSLSLEEQFYLVWPVLILGCLALGSRLTQRGHGRLIAGIVVTTVVVISFAFSLAETAAHPTEAYFSTFSRAWELGAGALLAICAPLFARLPRAFCVLLAWVGLIILLASLFVINDTLPFPAPWAALPVGATLLVIGSGIRGSKTGLFPLTNALSVFVGNLSYSLYLWHLPVIVFALLLLPAPTLENALIIGGLILATSLISYFLIEQPLHRSPWLKRFGSQTGGSQAGAQFDGDDLRGGKRAARNAAWQEWRDRFGTQFILSAVGLVALVAVIAVSVEVSLRDAPLPGSPIATSLAVPDQDPTVALQAQLAAAASSSSWPTDLSPSLDDAISRTSSDSPASACFAVGDTPNFDECTWGSHSAPNHLYLVGDSTALAYAPAFKEIAEASDGLWQITTVGLYGCRFTEVLVQNDGSGVMDSCTQRKDDIAAKIAADAPRLVVVSNAFALGTSSVGTPLSVGDITSSTSAESAKYNAAGRVVYLAPPPLGTDLGRCYSQVSSPQDCNAGIDQAWQDFAAATDAAATADGDHFVTSLPFSCSNGVCPAFAGTLPTKYDSVHLTAEYSAHIGPVILQSLVALGLM
ncbi:acyltransferase family protein [Subtercola frigoramans]|uniref:Peptidoglycan/LPS O-acetylase OafA/YrhL n=1 Tax=Subtercola frigoramans TaxID=120298 RepID=A0ABS2L3F1_9MICO|nr:acyltransferase family protein [Subtercola frigoramans]MBM7471544.1 peptidoglycan/LPS O-acetylase OafA/YrhL [Subtercola frigoramans]